MGLVRPAIVDDPLQARAAREPAAPPTASELARQPPSVAPAASEQPSQADPYGGSPKVTVSMRATKELWDRLGVLSRRLEDEGMRTGRTEITEALWHFYAPKTPDEARELVRSYRRVRLG